MSGEILGYLALVLGLIAMTMKKMLILRVMHAASVLLYLAYGVIIAAYPLIIGGSLFFIIHLYHILKIVRHEEE